MSAKEIVLLVLGGVLVNNYAFQKFLGLSTLLGIERREKKLLAMGLSVLAVMLVTAPLAWLLQTKLLEPSHLEFLQIPVFVALILLVSRLLGLAAEKLLKKPLLDAYFLVIVLNSAVLGLAVQNAADKLSFPAVMLTALGVGLGFLAALPVFDGVQSRIDQQAVPKAFRGFPIQILAAGIVSLALLAFK